MRAEHLLGSEPLPWFQAASGRGCELWCAAMRLQGVGAEHRCNMIERQSVKRLPVADGRENVLCHLSHDQILDEEHLPKLQRRRHSVIERDPIEEVPREVIM